MHRYLTFLLSSLVAAQLGEIISYEAQRFSECQGLFATCRPTVSSCADYLCTQCYSFGGSGFKSCCNQNPPYLCFQTAEGGGASNGNPNGGIVTTSVDSNLAACSTAINVLSACETLTPGFTDLAGTSQAKCLCYVSSSWVPNAFDNAWGGCVAYASTADVTDYPALMSAEGLCQSAGNVLSAGGAAATAATTTTSSSIGGAATHGATATAGTVASTTTAAPTATVSNAGLRIHAYGSLMAGVGLICGWLVMVDLC